MFLPCMSAQPTGCGVFGWPWVFLKNSAQVGPCPHFFPASKCCCLLSSCRSAPPHLSTCCPSCHDITLLHAQLLPCAPAAPLPLFCWSCPAHGPPPLLPAQPLLARPSHMLLPLLHALPALPLLLPPEHPGTFYHCFFFKQGLGPCSPLSNLAAPILILYQLVSTFLYIISLLCY